MTNDRNPGDKIELTLPMPVKRVVAHRGKNKMAVWLQHQSPGSRVLPFELKEVKLLDGPFKHATELNIKSLLKYEPDRFLARFRKEAGLESKAEHYHGWEDDTLAGHKK